MNLKVQTPVASRKFLPCAIVFSMMCFASHFARGQAAPPPVPSQEEPEVLTRGPVHEAFAEPINFQTDDVQVAPTAPPDSIEEVPPDDRPEGDQFIWVPGYWSWDAERNNYIWISACWRAAPPNMSWTPGYWSQTSGGWEWVAGFWSPQDADEVEYLPTPPVSDSVQPPGQPPEVDAVWVPPCPYWSNGRYVERAGYWLRSQPDWMWVASHYVWTPRGYVFVRGHWDYPLNDRGVLFAPVAIPRAEYGRRGYTYSPSVVVDTQILSSNLFVSFRYSHYFFGDYYDDSSVQVGIVPWFDRRSRSTWYDPMYEYDRATLRISFSDWDQRERREYDLRRSDRDLRPPRTYRELETRVARAPVEQRNKIEVVQSFKTVVNNTTINNTTVNNTTVNNNRTTVNNNRTTVNNNDNRVANNKTSNIKFAKVDPAAKTKITQAAASQKKLVEQRKGWEAAAKPADKPVAAPREPTPQLAGERKEPTPPPTPTPADRARGNAAQPEARPAPAPADRGRGNANPQAAEPAVRPAPTPTPADRGRGPTAEPAARPAPNTADRARGVAADPQDAPAQTPAARGGGAAVDPNDRPAAAPAARGRGPAAQDDKPDPTPADRGRGAATPERKPAVQREVRAAQPEKVKITDVPARGKAAAGKAPPPEPTDEAKRKGADPKDDDKPAPATRPADRRGAGGR